MRYLSLAILSLLAACSPAQQSTAANDVLAAKTSYAAVLRVAVAYNELPRCSPAAPPLCSDQAAVETIRKANIAARSTLDAAERTVRDPAVSQSTAAAVVTGASNAVDAFQAVVALYSRKG